MPFISGLTQLRSLSIVGMAKNTGKTECLNYVLRRLWEEYPQVSLALTSIGIDGERRDQVTQTDLSTPRHSLCYGRKVLS